MKLRTLALAAVFALTGTLAIAQTAASSSKAGGPAASKPTTGASMPAATARGSMAMHRGKHHKMHHRAHHRHHRM
jgi:hypothetical protein